MVIILDCLEKFLLFLLDGFFDGLATDWKPFSFAFVKQPNKKQRIVSAVAAEKTEIFEEHLVQLPLSSPSQWLGWVEGSTSGGPLARQARARSRLMWSSPEAFSSRPRLRGRTPDPLGLPQNTRRGQMIFKVFRWIEISMNSTKAKIVMVKESFLSIHEHVLES